MSNKNEKWLDNSIQFPRLIAEIAATQVIDFAALGESMDLEQIEISELFERASTAWEQIKQLQDTNEAGDNLMRHLSGWRIAHDSETNEVIFFNDLTMSAHCYSLAEVYLLSCRQDIEDLRGDL
jgi:hypothetical protein